MIVRVLQGAAELRALAPAWRALFARLAWPLPFQSPDWLLPWWQAYHPGEIRAVCLWQGDQLLGLLPLYLTPPDRTLRPIGIGNSDYLDILLDRDLDEAAITTALDSIWDAVAALPGWALCDLQPLPARSILRHPLPQQAGCSAELQDGESAPVLQLPSRLGVAGESVPSRMLRNLRNDRGRLAAAGESRFFTASGAAVAPVLDRMIALHAARWAGRPEGSLLSGPVDQAFHQAAAAAASEAGNLRLLALELRGSIVAVYYGFQNGPAAYAYLGGFEQSSGRLSLGTLVVAHAIERAIADGAREFHFLRGREAYKFAWGALDRSTFRIVLQRENF